MSSQSGIVPSDALVASFHAFASSPERERALVLGINQSELSINVCNTLPATNSLHEDLDKLVSTLLSETQCAYVIFRAEEGDANNTFVFVSYVPDNAPVKSKMIYASTKNTLLRSLGTQFFNPVIFANSSDELTGEGWKKTQESLNAAAPLSESEINLQKVMESTSSVPTTSLPQQRGKIFSDNDTSLLFQLDEELQSTLENLQTSNNTILTMTISNEILKLANSGKISSPNEIISHMEKTSPSSPAYHLYSNDSGDWYFFLSCPSGSKVRDRMLYASNKQGLLGHLKSQGWEFTKVIEVGDADELDTTGLQKESVVEDHSSASKLRFAKPRGPRRR